MLPFCQILRKYPEIPKSDRLCSSTVLNIHFFIKIEYFIRLLSCEPVPLRTHKACFQLISSPGGLRTRRRGEEGMIGGIHLPLLAMTSRLAVDETSR